MKTQLIVSVIFTGFVAFSFGYELACALRIQRKLTFAFMACALATSLFADLAVIRNALGK